jgi:hypothetical protein
VLPDGEDAGGGVDVDGAGWGAGAAAAEAGGGLGGVGAGSGVLTAGGAGVALLRCGRSVRGSTYFSESPILIPR